MVDKRLFGEYQYALRTNVTLLRQTVERLIADTEGMDADMARDHLKREYPRLVKVFGRIASSAAVDFYQRNRDAHFEDDEAEVAYVAQPAPEVSEQRALTDISLAEREGIGNLPGFATTTVMQRADRVMEYNAARDPAHPCWAIVPRAGACGFCVMVAANGFYMKHEPVKVQRHEHCTCVAVVDFDTENPRLDGYDPDALDRQYRLGIEDAGDIQARWDALTPEERASYKRKGRSAYDVFRTKEITRAMDARIARVEAYKERERALGRDVKAAKAGGIKVPYHVWVNRTDGLLGTAGIAQDSVHIQHGADFQPHELLLTKRLVDAGHDVEVLRASSVPGAHTPDFLVDGVPIEAKRLEAWSEDRLGKKIHEASAQSRDVLIDLSLETVSHDAAVRKATEVLGQPMFRYLSKYERKHGYSRGQKELRVDSVTLVFHDHIEKVAR